MRGVSQNQCQRSDTNNQNFVTTQLWQKKTISRAPGPGLVHANILDILNKTEKNIRRRGFQEFRNKSLRSCKILRLQNFREKEVKSELLTDASLAVFGDFIFHFFVQQRENVQQKNNMKAGEKALFWIVFFMTVEQI